MLELKGVEVMYNGVILAVKGLSLSVPAGGCIALLGGNGVGKSTTLKAISGLIRSEDGAVSGGEILCDGQAIHHLSPDVLVRRGIAHVMEGRRPLSHLTVEQNLVAGGSILSSRRDLAAMLDSVYELVPRLRILRNRVAGYLSGGEQQLMVIARAMMSKPRLMLLDEPSLGLAPMMVEEVYGLLRRLRRGGLALLVVEQNTRVALDLADWAYVMEGGRIVLDGASEDVRQNPDVKEFYLGFGAENQRKSFRDVKHYRRRKRWLG